MIKELILKKVVKTAFESFVGANVMWKVADFFVRVTHDHDSVLKHTSKQKKCALRTLHVSVCSKTCSRPPREVRQK